MDTEDIKKFNILVYLLLNAIILIGIILIWPDTISSQKTLAIILVITLTEGIFWITALIDGLKLPVLVYRKKYDELMAKK